MLAMRTIFMSSLFSQVKKYFLYAQMSIQCFEYAFPVIYLLLVHMKTSHQSKNSVIIEH
jgi:hypothetical protein